MASRPLRNVEYRSSRNTAAEEHEKLLKAQSEPVFKWKRAKVAYNPNANFEVTKWVKTDTLADLISPNISIEQLSNKELIVAESTPENNSLAETKAGSNESEKLALKPDDNIDLDSNLKDSTQVSDKSPSELEVGLVANEKDLEGGLLPTDVDETTQIITENATDDLSDEDKNNESMGLSVSRNEAENPDEGNLVNYKTVTESNDKGHYSDNNSSDYREDNMSTK